MASGGSMVPQMVSNPPGIPAIQDHLPHELFSHK